MAVLRARRRATKRDKTPDIGRGLQKESARTRI
jgi:hypothetical protein